MDSTDDLHCFSLRVGASTALDGHNRITLNLSVPLREVHRVFLTGMGVTNPSSAELRVRFLNSSGLKTLTSPVAGPAGTDYVTDAIYLLVQAITPSQVQHMGVATPVLQSLPGHRAAEIVHLEIEVTNWTGAAVTFDQMALQFVYSTQKNTQLNPAGRRVLNALDEVKDVGRL